MKYKKVISITVIFLALVILFQNCGKLSSRSSSSYSSQNLNIPKGYVQVGDMIVDQNNISAQDLKNHFGIIKDYGV